MPLSRSDCAEVNDDLFKCPVTMETFYKSISAIQRITVRAQKTDVLGERERDRQREIGLRKSRRA